MDPTTHLAAESSLERHAAKSSLPHIASEKTMRTNIPLKTQVEDQSPSEPPGKQLIQDALPTDESLEKRKDMQKPAAGVPHISPRGALSTLFAPTIGGVSPTAPTDKLAFTAKTPEITPLPRTLPAIFPRLMTKSQIMRIPADRRLFSQVESLSAVHPHHESLRSPQDHVKECVTQHIATYSDKPQMLNRFFRNEIVRFAQEKGYLRGRWADNERGRDMPPRYKKKWRGLVAKNGKGGKYTWGNHMDSVSSVMKTQSQVHHLERVLEEQRFRKTNQDIESSSLAEGADRSWLHRVASHLIDTPYTYVDSLSRRVDEVYEGDDNLYEGHREEDNKPCVPALIVPLSEHQRVLAAAAQAERQAKEVPISESDAIFGTKAGTRADFSKKVKELPYSADEKSDLIDTDPRKFSGFLLTGTNAVIPMAAFEPKALHTAQARAMYALPSTIREKIPDLMRYISRKRPNRVPKEALMPYTFEHGLSYKNALMAQLDSEAGITQPLTTAPISDPAIPSDIDRMDLINTAAGPSLHVAARKHYADAGAIEQLEMLPPHLRHPHSAKHAQAEDEEQAQGEARMPGVQPSACAMGGALTPMELAAEFFEELPKRVDGGGTIGELTREKRVSQQDYPRIGEKMSRDRSSRGSLIKDVVALDEEEGEEGKVR